jgi:hypothetical protein
VLVLQGHAEGAVPHYANALRVREMVAADHYDVGQICRSLGELYRSLGREEDAAPLMARAEAIDQLSQAK